MIPVVIESPYAGNIKKNLRYLRACMYDCLLRGEAPYASHALYTQPGVLRDDDPNERMLGITAGFEIRKLFSKTVFYVDLGYSRGMQLAVDALKLIPEHIVEYRVLPPDWEEQLFAREQNNSGAVVGWMSSFYTMAEEHTL